MTTAVAGVFLDSTGPWNSLSWKTLGLKCSLAKKTRWWRYCHVICFLPSSGKITRYTRSSVKFCACHDHNCDDDDSLLLEHNRSSNFFPEIPSTIPVTQQQLKIQTRNLDEQKIQHLNIVHRSLPVHHIYHVTAISSPWIWDIRPLKLRAVRSEGKHEWWKTATWTTIQNITRRTPHLQPHLEHSLGLNLAHRRIENLLWN